MEDRGKEQNREKRSWRRNSGKNSVPENGAFSGSVSLSGKRSFTSRSMSFTYLENLLLREAEDITSTLVRERKGFLELLEQNLSSDIIVLIVRILRKICDSKFDTTKFQVLQSALNERFVNHLQTFIACLPSQNASQRKSSTYFWNDPNSFFTNICEICDDVLKALPTFACKRLPVILKSLKIYIPLLEQEQKIRISEETKTNVEKKLEFIQICVKDNEKNEKSKKEETIEVGEEPPDDFRQISVYPSPAEIVGGQGFLRENVIKGPYQSVNHYLDVQFRLLREDFVGPLREGITSYRSSVPINQIDDVKIHKDVRFLNTETINEYYCLRLQFASKKKKLPNFETSKRFMYGALLCFTKDNFNTLFFGKVAQRKLEDLKNGQLIVAFDEKLTVDYNVDYLMVECSVYFEPYFHVLTVLKKLTEENFPLERYIIRVNPSIQSPEYLTDGDTIRYTIESHEFDPTSQWPDEHFYNFNESQLTAFKAAITQELTVIQGPPGTGKTYLGLRVAQTLLENKNYWYEKTPILVICYTNHALDQFLEGLIPYTSDIIRVGGQSKNPKLDEFNLRNKVSRDLGVSLKRMEVQACLKTIKQTTEILQQTGYWNSVLSFDFFKEVVPELSDSWFGKARKDQIIDWLLRGAQCGQNLINLQEYLNTIQVQAELNNINLDDEDHRNDVDSHINATFDNIFDEVINTTNNRSDSRNFLITLKSLRDQIHLLQSDLTRLRQEPTPSLEHLIREETIHYQCEELTEKYEYLKAQLSAGRRLQNLSEKPERIDLDNPHKMDFQDRWKLYFYWLNLFRNRESDVLKMTCEDFPEVYKVYEEMREIEDLKTMRDALVVGMTTTSAARLRSTLQTLKNPIVIVEEAAEVLEAHIVTSVTKECKQLILIGDHKQLRPSTANYTVEKQYHLGISLFERMIINNIHCYTLNVQHRMRPEISRLIQSTIYPFLENHPSVHQRPSIVGVDNCLFFLNHKNPEEPCEGSSKVNQHEVTFLISLARHLILNGYKPENITILAAYLGQFFAFQKERKLHQDLLKGVRISVLDNYQGEESDIILLSLVRNNEENKIGFLKIENRVCVALSRARNGMYVMGNIDQLCHERTVWRDIRKILEEQKAIGEALPVRCQIHQDQVTLLKCETDFLAISEGGCSKICDAELPCGHKCSSLCHVRDRNHTLFKCQVECNKNLCNTDASHKCKKMCFEECGPCIYSVQKPLSCGHVAEIPCHKDPESFNCQVLVTTKLPCGHETDKPCHADPVTFRCPYICDVKVEPCGHACEQLCHIRRDPDHLEYKCRKPCAKFQKNCTLLEEDHRCQKLCYQDCDECRIVVRKRRTVCSHMYDVACCDSVDDIMCRKPCTKRLQCGHTCKNRCNEPCQECPLTVFKTSPVCGHPIKVRCSEQPDRKYCNKKCPLKLDCGHPCQEKCNEPCTTNCRQIVTSGPAKLAECGHFVTAVECNMAQTKVNPKLLVKYCREPCSFKLKCEHLCSGSCGQCFQGRVHKRCAEKCGAILVCDHPCDTPCRQACRPCSRKCTYRCEHSACSKSCGEICTPCVEPCPRKCVHRRCHKKCWEICDVPPCTDPCQEFLTCGHRCIGFCGDPCPPLCIVCDKEKVLEVFFGTESEEARYVFLKDCKHVVENGGMEMWLEYSQNQISYKTCPKCRAAIKTTQRYSDYIKRAVMDVAEVKNKINGRPEELRQKYNEIRETMKMLQAGCRITFNSFSSPILGLLKMLRSRMQFSGKGIRQYLNKYELQAIKSKLEILEYITKICCDDEALLQNSQELFLPQVSFIIKELARDPYYISDQELEDINREINRLSRIVELGRIKNTTQYKTLYKGDKLKSMLDGIEKIMFSCKRFSKEDNKELKKLLKELSAFTASGIAISEEEKRTILSAMGFSKGHWFKCPNGHIYAIGECGGAMEEATCNECGAKIGGRNHSLLGDNTVATEMDGAVHGAWSEAANLENYNIEDFE